ncbi:SH3 domain-containing protein [Kurthia massiliensis]|uniref:SH3 domain-containing protein n=1 Tax=Kurthia massiliensis TaxID=1033739 RepID=UPI00028900E0|nr:SH3 domain-containing protein [Kurthia massiliensis]
MKLLKATLAVAIATSTLATVTLPITSHAETVKKVKTTTMYTNHGVNVRKAPSVTSDVLGVLPKNEKIKVVKKINKIWYEILYNDQKAYVSADYVSKKRVVTLPKVVEKGYVQNTNGIPLNVRAKASTKSAIIGTIKLGATVHLTKKYSTKKNVEWYEVVHNNQVGYVVSQYVGFKKAPTPAPTVVKNGTVRNVTLNVRAKPSDTSKVLGKLKPGIVVTFTEKYTTASKDQWLKIKYKKGTAYVSKQYIDFLIPAP